MTQKRHLRLRAKSSTWLATASLFLASVIISPVMNLTTAAPASAALTTSPITFNSGVNTGTLGTATSLDASVLASTDGVTFTPAYVVQTCGPLASTIPGTMWVSTAYAGTNGGTPSPTNHCNPGAGPFYYKVSFTLPAAFTQPVLTIQDYSDDQATAVSLNGNVPFYTAVDNNTGYDTLGQPQDTTVSDFHSGTNTIEFTVSNITSTGGGMGPSGIDFAGLVTYVQPTTLTYTGDTSFVAGQAGTLSATLTTNGGTPLGGETVTLGLGTLTCSGTTNTFGNVMCSVTPSDSQVGPNTPITGTFAGDEYSSSSPLFIGSPPPSSTSGYSGSTLSTTASVFNELALGAFVIGDASPSPSLTSGGTAYFWGSQWAQNNGFSGKVKKIPSAMKGFVNDASLVFSKNLCGSTWTTMPGNSSAPPSSLPSQIYVIVTNNVKQTGSVISGTIEQVDLVSVNPGYGPAPGHVGTGTLVSSVCSTPGP